MNSPRILLFALLLFGVFVSVSYSFPVEDYLYSGETLKLVSSENFTLYGAKFELIKINNSEVFLLKNGEVDLNTTEVYDVIKSYYKSKYAPNQSDMNEVTSLVRAYNDSLNDGTRWKGKEEGSCRQMLLLDGRLSYRGEPLYCTNDTACDYISLTFYNSAPYTEGVRQSIAYKDAAAALKEFAYASNELQSLMDTNLDYVSNLNEDNMVEAFTYIKASIPKLRADELKLEQTVFRTPRKDDKADYDLCKKQNNGAGCFGLCPDISFDETKLNALDSKLTAIMSKIGPFSNYAVISSTLISNSDARLNYRAGEDKASFYSSKFNPLKAEANISIKKGDYALSYVANITFKSKLDQLKALDSKIRSDYDKRIFQTMDSDLVEYASLSEYVYNQSDFALAIYNETFDAKQTTVAMIFEIQTSGDLSPELSERLGILVNSSLVLDAQFRKGLSPDQYYILKEGYLNLSSELSGILQQQKEFVALSKFRALSRRVNNQVYDVAVSSSIVPQSTLSSNAQLLPLLMAVLMFLCLSALLFFLFLVFISGMKNLSFNRVMAPAAVFVLGIGAIFVFSASLYFYLGKTSTDADIDEFMITMGSQQNASIVLELANAPTDSSVSMKNCAGLLRDSLASTYANRTVDIYERYASTCIINGVQSDFEGCSPSAGVPSFVFEYSALSSRPSFSTIFDDRAYFSGDSAYFSACQIAAVFN